ncbi:MAG: hypothetical protein ABIT37_23930 [Luteolibacter sp.]
MDKEQARFVLRSFRPDGADVNDTDFAEALALAMENRELGEWLAKERAFDAAFAKALGSIDLPETLREDIIACLAGERGDFPQAEDSSDSLLIGAFASIQPPPFLRDELIAAMDRTAAKDNNVVINPGGSSFWRKAGIPLAAAAGIALAFVFTRPDKVTPLAHSGHLSANVVQASFIKTFESPTFDLEEKQTDHTVLVQHLRDRKLPCPSCLPPGLMNVDAIGCRELLIDGKRGSVICFNVSETGVTHLVIFKRDDIEGNFPERAKALMQQKGKWASAQWQDGNKIYIMIGNTDVKKLVTLL